MKTVNKDLTDSSEQNAIAEKVADRILDRMDTPSPCDSSSEMVNLTVEAAIGRHEKECREAGPIKELREEVAKLRAWAKVAAVALALSPLWVAIGGYALSGYIVSRFEGLQPAHRALFVPPAAAAPKVGDK